MGVEEMSHVCVDILNLISIIHPCHYLATIYSVSVSWILTVVLPEPERMRLLSESATEVIGSVGPRNGSPTGFFASASQIRIVLSSEPEATRLPSGENATDLIQSVCPWNGSPTGFPVSASQIRMVLSSDPETMRLPSGKNAIDVMQSVCPWNGCPTGFPVSASQIRIVSSSDPEITTLGMTL